MSNGSSRSPVRLATTTSAFDTGLLTKLKSVWECTQSEYDLIIESLGSGQALDLAVNHGADVTLTHSPVREGELLACHILKCRKHIFYNQFVFVGGGDNPKVIGDDWLLKKCFKAIANNPSFTFVSRNDDSGTNVREDEIWELLYPLIGKPSNVENMDPSPNGRGMMATLVYTNWLAANCEPAFTLSDDGTFFRYEFLKEENEPLGPSIVCDLGPSDNKLSVRSHVAPPDPPDPWALNQYALSLVNPCVAQGDFTGAKAFFGWMFGDEAKNIIMEYGENEINRPYFNYNAEQDEPDSPFLRLLYHMRQQRNRKYYERMYLNR